MANHQRITKEQVVNPVSKLPKPAVADTAYHSPSRSPADTMQRLTANPHSLTHADIFQLQRTLGNRAVGGLFQGTTAQKPVIQAKPEVNTLGGRQEKESNRAAEQNRPLPNQLKMGIEALSGLSMDGVKVHYNSSKPAQLNALAYAQGTDIHLASGQEQHLPHEAWHVVQQSQDRVKAKTQINDGVKINNDNKLELEANVMGSKAISLGQYIQNWKKEKFKYRGMNVGHSNDFLKNLHPVKESSIVQGYFTINNQKTNDPDMFEESATEEEKRNYVWKYFLEQALKDSLKDELAKDPSLILEFKQKALQLAFEVTKYNFQAFVNQLKTLHRERKSMEVPMSERNSPANLPRLSQIPELGDKEKHSTAKYIRTENQITTAELFNSDEYTKGPAKRRRNKQAATTPKGSENQTWSKTGVQNRIKIWTCKIPLARHLAGFIWPLLQNSAEGKQWELKFREIDRLVDHRESENQSRIITIIRKSDSEVIKNLDRNDFMVGARQALKQALLDDVKHPADQQDVLFFDTLLKGAIGVEYQNEASQTFDLDARYAATGSGLSMILTHWRPILFFDWILAEDVLNHGN